MPKTRTQIIEESDWRHNSEGKIFVDQGEDLFYEQSEVDRLVDEEVKKIFESVVPTPLRDSMKLLTEATYQERLETLQQELYENGIYWSLSEKSLKAGNGDLLISKSKFDAVFAQHGVESVSFRKDSRVEAPLVEGSNPSNPNKCTRCNEIVHNGETIVTLHSGCYKED